MTLPAYRRCIFRLFQRVFFVDVVVKHNAVQMIDLMLEYDRRISF